MSNLNSPVNNIIKTSERKKYMSTLENKLGDKNVSRTPIHFKLMDKYQDLTSNIPKRNMIIFFSMFIIISVVLYYFKPGFILNVNKNSDSQSFKISSSKASGVRIHYDSSYF